MSVVTIRPNYSTKGEMNEKYRKRCSVASKCFPARKKQGPIISAPVHSVRIYASRKSKSKRREQTTLQQRQKKTKEEGAEEEERRKKKNDDEEEEEEEEEEEDDDERPEIDARTFFSD